ncbi:MAG: DMT family transporter [Bacteroidales bacterium]|nr:DMT family transporter [Bacteroidales bacterium]
MKRLNNAYLRLHLAILLAGGTGLFGRLITIGELPLVCYRVILAMVMLAGLLWWQKKHTFPPIRQVLQMAGCGALLAIHWVFYYGSIKAANVSIGAVCFALVGFFTAIVEPAMGKKRPSWTELCLSAITLVGILLIFGFNSQYRLGIGLGIVSSLIFTFFSVFSKRVQAFSGESSSTVLLYQLMGGAVVLIFLLPLYHWVFPATGIRPSQADCWYLLLFASVFTIAPFLLQLQALRSISAFTVNLSYNLEPIYTILLAIILFNEATELDIYFWMGIGLILLSVALQTYSSIKKKQLNK